jgi:hypothetical protein
VNSARSSRLHGLAALVLAVALIAPGSAIAQSAFPLKSVGDPGVVPANEVNPSNWVSAGPGGNNYVRNFDACTYIAPFNNFQSNYQQYNVGNCAPIQTPWIRLRAWETKGWAIYCPDSAPNSWVPSDGGALSQWTSAYSVENMNELGGNTSGPSPPAKNDYYTTNWSVHHQYWLYLVGCSPQAWENVGDGGAYCCGQGTSAIPTFSSGSAASAAPRAVTATLRKGPARRRTPIGTGYYSLTREVDLEPDSKRTYRLKCQRGFRLRRARETVGWFTKRKPFRKLFGDVKETQKRLGERGYQVTVTTDDRVKEGKARLQLDIGCARPGAPDPPLRPTGPFR